MSLKSRCYAALLGPVIATAMPVYAGTEGEDALFDLSLEDLMSIEVRSASKRSEALIDAAAAIYVVTNEDIRRSGSSTVPEVLRMVPGLSVKQVDGNKWSVSSRGFSGRFANKLLVLIDGRTVYNPSFSGVYWENLDLVLQDIERIEVIRGPGASLWGSNAVNGVINISTKSAKNTQGAMVASRYSSNDQRDLAWRFGAQATEDTSYRVYAKYSKTGELYSEQGGTASDRKESIKAGFRVDKSDTNGKILTLSGEVFNSNADQLFLNLLVDSPGYLEFFEDPIDEKGWHLMSQWRSGAASGSELSAQLYVDHFERVEDLQDEARTSFDLELQYEFSPLGNSRIVVGGGYRADDHKTRQTAYSLFRPADRYTAVANFFAQGEFRFLDDRLNVIFGSKFEHSGYSPNSIDTQPSARFAYQLTANSTVWGSASKALRTAARAEIEGAFLAQTVINDTQPLFVNTFGNKDQLPEELVALEAGYRLALDSGWMIDLSVFHHDYSKLRSLILDFPEFVNGQLLTQGVFGNEETADSHGLELAVDWSISPRWRLKSSYSFITINDRQMAQDQLNRQVPKHQVNLRSMYNFSSNLHFDVWLRHASDTERSDAEEFFAMDMRLNWSLYEGVDVSVIAEDIFNDRYCAEETLFVITENACTKRAVSAELVWKF